MLLSSLGETESNRPASNGVEAGEPKSKKRVDFAIYKIGIMLANFVLGIDTKPVRTKQNSGETNLEQLDAPNPNVNCLKHATYHGPTRHSYRPALDLEFNEPDSLAESSSSSALLSEFQSSDTDPPRKTSSTSAESESSINNQLYGQILRRTHRRSSSNTSNESSNINPSFDPDEDSKYFNNEIENLHVVEEEERNSRPTTLDLKGAHNKRKKHYYCYHKNSQQKQNIYSNRMPYSPGTSSSPDSSCTDSWSTPPTTNSTPQKAVRFRVVDKESIEESNIDSESPNLLDMPVAGQSQDSTVPLRALIHSRNIKSFPRKNI